MKNFSKKIFTIRMFLGRLAKVTDNSQPTGIIEKLERIATDHPYQWIKHEFKNWRFNRTPETNKYCPKTLLTCESIARAGDAVRFGRPISKEGQSTYSLLLNRGISRKDLRIAVFSNFINDDGSISFKPLKLRIGQVLSWWLLALSAIALIDFAIWLMHSPADLLTSFTAFGIFSIVLTTLEYPLIVLGLRPVQVASRIKQISPSYLLS